jgi:hypothetical protein
VLIAVVCFVVGVVATAAWLFTRPAENNYPSSHVKKSDLPPPRASLEAGKNSRESERLGSVPEVRQTAGTERNETRRELDDQKAREREQKAAKENWNYNGEDFLLSLTEVKISDLGINDDTYRIMRNMWQLDRAILASDRKPTISWDDWLKRRDLTTHAKRLLVMVKLENTSERKILTYYPEREATLRDEKFALPTFSLKDDVGNYIGCSPFYQLPGMAPRGTRGVTLPPGKTLTDIQVFDLPPPKTRHLLLKVDSEAVQFNGTWPKIMRNWEVKILLSRIRVD